MKPLVWINLLLGIWLMNSPFLLRLLYRGTFKVTWVDFIFGFVIAVISLARLVSRTTKELLITDGIVTTIAILTVLNPLLYNYYGVTMATLNNLLVGGAVCLLAAYIEWRDLHRHF